MNAARQKLGKKPVADKRTSRAVGFQVILCITSRGERLKNVFPAAVLIFLLTFPISSIACSTASCAGNGDEMRRDFVVRITFEDKPLSGVSVEITGTKTFSAISSADGTVNVEGLPAGNYWLNTSLLGISAGSECFHVTSHSSGKARRMVRYEWDDYSAPVIRRVAGKLIDSQPGQGGNPIWNLTHRVDAPVSEAVLKLQNPLTGTMYSTTADGNGDFSFDPIPNGTYVLHVEGGTTPAGRNYVTDKVVRLSETARPSSLVLEWRPAGGGSCGGASLQLRDP